jgi:hypothetical protein
MYYIVSMVFFRIVSQTFSQIGKYNHPFSKYTRDEQLNIFVKVPAVIGCACGAVSGAVEGYDYSKKDHFVSNMIFTTVGMFYYSIFGGVSGALWPISIPIIVSRRL